MCTLDIRDIIVQFDGQDLSKYGLFPLFAWYLNDVIHLPYYFAQISVNRKRNHSRRRRGKKPLYTDQHMCMGLVAISTLGIPRISQIDDLLKQAGFSPQITIDRNANRTVNRVVPVL